MNADGIRGTPAAKELADEEFPMIFTASQWQELEQQTLAFRYLVSGIPIPPYLISTLIDFPSSFLSPHHQPSLPIGWGCFQVGYGRKTDPEPERCRRTDGKKWRCSKEANPNSKYCDKHMNRGKSKSKKKQIQHLNNNPNTNTTTDETNTIPHAITSSVSPSSQPYQYQYQASSFSPFVSPSSGSRQSPQYSTMQAQNQPYPPWLLDAQLYDHQQPNKTIRFDF